MDFFEGILSDPEEDVESTVIPDAFENLLDLGDLGENVGSSVLPPEILDAAENLRVDADIELNASGDCGGNLKTFDDAHAMLNSENFNDFNVHTDSSATSEVLAFSENLLTSVSFRDHKLNGDSTRELEVSGPVPNLMSTAAALDPELNNSSLIHDLNDLSRSLPTSLTVTEPNVSAEFISKPETSFNLSTTVASCNPATDSDLTVIQDILRTTFVDSDPKVVNNSNAGSQNFDSDHVGLSSVGVSDAAANADFFDNIRHCSSFSSVEPSLEKEGVQTSVNTMPMQRDCISWKPHEYNVAKVLVGTLSQVADGVQHKKSYGDLRNKTEGVSNGYSNDVTRPVICEDVATELVGSRRVRLKCGLCNKTFGDQQRLSRHERNYHASEAFKCPQCPKEFVLKHHLKEHMITHTQEKRFACTVCGVRFKRRNQVTRHMQKHSGTESFPCRKCQELFNSRGLLNRHMEKCHGSAAVSRFMCSCEMCGRKYATRESLVSHVRRIHGVELNGEARPTVEMRIQGASEVDSHGSSSTDGYEDDGSPFLLGDKVPRADQTANFLPHDTASAIDGGSHSSTSPLGYTDNVGSVIGTGAAHKVRRLHGAGDAVKKKRNSKKSFKKLIGVQKDKRNNRVAKVKTRKLLIKKAAHTLSAGMDEHTYCKSISNKNVTSAVSEDDGTFECARTKDLRLTSEDALNELFFYRMLPSAKSEPIRSLKYEHTYIKSHGDIHIQAPPEPKKPPCVKIKRKRRPVTDKCTTAKKVVVLNVNVRRQPKRVKRNRVFGEACPKSKKPKTRIVSSGAKQSVLAGLKKRVTPSSKLAGTNRVLGNAGPKSKKALYICEICNEGLAHRNMVLLHLQSHLGDGKTDRLFAAEVSCFRRAEPRKHIIV